MPFKDMNSLSPCQDKSPGRLGFPEAGPCRDRPISPERQHRGDAAEEGQREDAEAVLKGSVVNILGKFGRLSKSLYYVVISRFVGADVLGLYTLGWSLVDLVSKFGLFGLDRGVVRFVSQHQSDGDAEGTHRTIGQALVLGLAAGRSGINLLNTVFFVIVNVGLHVLLIPLYGVSGAALAAAIAMSLVCFLRIAEVGLLLGIHPFRRSLLKPFAAAALAFSVGLSLLQLGSPWTILSGLSLPLCFGLLGAFGVEEDDRELLQRLRDRVPFLRRPPQLRLASSPALALRRTDL
ncbi:MAG: polysaccharide biosynthesis protein [Candidatus Latescibacteria bacterium]|nr:polysaccharide biosynthesis protein [Candidatus Latescibacterota bacterium]